MDILKANNYDINILKNPNFIRPTENVHGYNPNLGTYPPQNENAFDFRFNGMGYPSQNKVRNPSIQPQSQNIIGDMMGTENAIQFYLYTR